MAPKNIRTAIVWFRRDLRLADNRPLTEACSSADMVLPVFVFDTHILELLEDRDDRRIAFIHRAVYDLRMTLQGLGSDLLVLHGDPVTIIPRLAEEYGAEAVFAGTDYESYSIRRDEAVASLLERQRRTLLLYTDHVVFDNADVLNSSGSPYRVFTPYKRAWLARLEDERATGQDPLREWSPDISRLLTSSAPLFRVPQLSLSDLGFSSPLNPMDAGEAAARVRLHRFLDRIDRYKDTRDLPAVDGTSRLSVDFRFGTISIREAFRAAMSRTGAGAETWVSELIWREFYMMILDHFPHVEYSAFNTAYDRIVWTGSEERFETWCDGRTGYPIVDAAMRELRATGWMHNRLRMVTAMFLTKDLLVDWRLGEAWFARWLLDFELASNNGGWQWCASTGVDAAPYFRIFNPTLQSRRFDPSGDYIRRWCPELSGFSDARIHWPHDADEKEVSAANCIPGIDYPSPVVDHAVQKEKALALFRRLG